MGVGDRLGQRAVVRHHHQRRVAELAHQRVGRHLLGEQVEPRGRLVGKHEGRSRQQHPRDGQALELPARHLRRTPPEQLGSQAQVVDQLLDALRVGTVAAYDVAQPGLDRHECREGERRVLVELLHPARQRRVVDDPPGVHPDEPEQRPAERGLADPARAAQRDPLPRVHPHVEVGEEHLLAVGLADAGRRDQRLARRRPAGALPRVAPPRGVGGDEPAAVGVDGTLQHLGGGTVLDHLGVAHHRDVAPEGRGEAQVVGDRQQQPAGVDVATQQLREPVDRGRVEALGRLVDHQHPGATDRRGGVRHPLGHAAGQGVRIGAGGAGEPDVRQRGDGPLACGLRRDAEGALLDLAPDPHRGVEREGRLLREHADLASPQLAPVGPFGQRHQAAVEVELAVHLQRGRERAHQGVRQQGLARPALADDRERSPLLQADPGHVDQPAAGMGHDHVVHLERRHEGTSLCRRPRKPAVSRNSTATGARESHGATS